ncbi:uncharacterized protein CC84DRAFT_1181388 [Paraphaeosphaeria sporulosa]|uniref:Uncharacterized protein n=1 Tax=Paraphaeosphaeria sporulosa TaxID=1460663 RepID=A0A177BVA6_9PLEO|nr:uncharacterized protein CC84DRAFT_1181388 [Paraphaeosphaeria sporulosa]OAF99244.1 hypothetical protein CC84DRAFT_1181388 [Paraphaeosphaeria sporulosa]
MSPALELPEDDPRREEGRETYLARGLRTTMINLLNQYQLDARPKDPITLSQQNTNQRFYGLRSPQGTMVAEINLRRTDQGVHHVTIPRSGHEIVDQISGEEAHSIVEANLLAIRQAADVIDHSPRFLVDGVAIPGVVESRERNEMPRTSREAARDRLHKHVIVEVPVRIQYVNEQGSTDTSSIMVNFSMTIRRSPEDEYDWIYDCDEDGSYNHMIWFTNELVINGSSPYDSDGN